jgi:alpha-tubulin suppressor-like RCC1 family protein
VWFVGLVAVTSASAQTAAGGLNHTVILKSDDTVWTVGHNGVGQLGDATWTLRSAPVQVGGLTDIVSVAAGDNHSMAITSTGALYLCTTTAARSGMGRRPTVTPRSSRP